MDETLLIRQARQGDLEAFNQLVLLHQDRVYNLAWRILGESAAAEDVTQETFITAFRKLSGFRGGSFSAWLLRIATNRCYDELRRRKRRPAVSLEGEEETADDAPQRWLADEAPSPEAQVAARQLDAAIQRCLDALPEPFRLVAVLVDVEGFSYQQAARMLQKPLGTIRSRLARARLRLRECLARVRELFPDGFRLVDSES